MTAAAVDLVVRNARVVTESGIVDGGVAANDGTIIEIGASCRLPDGETEVDANGGFLLPGIIDPHVHLGRRDGPYFDQLAVEFETETRGALYGGVTCLLNFVEHADAYLSSLDRFVEVGEANSYVDFGHHFVVSHGHHVDEVEALAERGATSFKMFFNMYKYHDIDIEPCEADRVYRVLSSIADVPGAIGMFHAENAELQREREREVRAAGRTDIAAWADASPPAAEAMQIDHIGHLSAFTDAEVYCVHVSSAEGVEAIERARRRGVRLRGETLVNFLVNTTDDDLGVWGKISPPLRRERHQRRLWEALRSGVIDHVGTDHIATSLEGIEQGRGRHGEHLWDRPPGLQPSLEYFLPMMLTEGYNGNRLSMTRLAEVCSTNAAKTFGLYPRKGHIAVGADADLVVVDTNATTTIDDEFFHTREPRWSPVHGREVRGRPTQTIVGGELAVAEGELLVEPGRGSYLAR